MKQLFLYIGLTLIVQAQAQLFINEICPQNNGGFQDENGVSHDWIELYNAGDDTINLKGYGLTDKLGNPYRWTFNEVEILPDSFLVVFASGDSIQYQPDTLLPLNAIKGFGDVYADGDNGGNSFNEYLAFPNSYFGELPSGDSGISMRINLLGGSLNYSYAGFRNIFNPNRWPVNFTGYHELRIKAEITKGKNLWAGIMQNWESGEVGHKLRMEGTGEVETYVLPLTGDVYPLEIDKIQGIEFYAETYGITEYTIHELVFLPKRSVIHTNFKLAAEGEIVQLTDSLGNVVDVMPYPAMNKNVSYGRMTDGSESLQVFLVPTPNVTNEYVPVETTCFKTIKASHQAGIYQNGFSLSLTGSSEIRYTTDGSLPDKQSLQYTTPVWIDSSTVIRAACFEEDKSGEVMTASYIFHEQGNLPIVALSTAPQHLFSEEEGIFADGPNFTSQFPHYGANYWKTWEKPVHVEFFETDGRKVICQDAGIDVFGGWSKAYPQKSMHIKADKQYGKARFEHQLFPNKPQNSFKHFVLRNSGNDNNKTHLLDGFNHVLTQNTHVDNQAYRPAVVFINGEYWGILNLREKINDNYVEDNFGMPDEIVQIVGALGDEVDGGPNSLLEIQTLANSIDLSDDVLFPVVADSFDLDNMIDYFAINLYIGNADWPSTNLKLWKQLSGERKFRYLMYDVDFSTGTVFSPSYDQVTRILEPSVNAPNYGTPNAEILKALLQNEKFRNRFLNRYADLINTIYRPENAIKVLDSLKAHVADEMMLHRERWEATGSWESHFNNIYPFLENRPRYAREELVNYFGLLDTFNLEVEVVPEGAGFVKVNTIYPNIFPWEGVYFKGVPITVEAYANPGFKFERWENDENSTSTKILTLEMNESGTLIAFFSGEKKEASLVLSEINYHSAESHDAGDWVEFTVKGDAPLNVSNWTFRDGKNYHEYTFKDSTWLQPDSYFVLAEDTVSFKAQFPDKECLDRFDFGLDNDVEWIRVLDIKGAAMINFSYSDKDPWSPDADGKGYTLELKDIRALQSDPSNWSSGCKFGTPLKAYKSGCKEVVEEMPKEIRLAPNPTSGMVEVLVPNDRLINKMEVVNLEGHKVWEMEFEEKNSIITLDLSLFSKGMYVIRCLTNQGITHHKLILN